MKYYVYVIRSKEGFQYTGMTEDLVDRLAKHNNKELSFWTKRGNDWQIVYFEEFHDKAEALKRERWLKTGAGRDFVKKKLNK